LQVTIVFKTLCESLQPFNQCIGHNALFTLQ